MNIESILKYQSVDAKIYDIEQKLLNSNFKKKANELSAIAKKAQNRSLELEIEAEKVLKDIANAIARKDQKLTPQNIPHYQQTYNKAKEVIDGIYKEEEEFRKHQFEI